MSIIAVVSNIIDPSGRPATPTNPIEHDIPCECGFVNRVEVQTPRFYNLPQTSFVVAEHSGPTICPGCLQAVTPCIISLANVVLKCIPINKKQAVMPLAPGESPVPEKTAQEDPASETSTDRVM